MRGIEVTFRKTECHKNKKGLVPLKASFLQSPFVV